MLCLLLRLTLTQVIVNVEQLGNTDLHLISDFTLNEMSRFVSLKGKRVPSLRHYGGSSNMDSKFPQIRIAPRLASEGVPIYTHQLRDLLDAHNSRHNTNN